MFNIEAEVEDLGEQRNDRLEPKQASSVLPKIIEAFTPQTMTEKALTAWRRAQKGIIDVQQATSAPESPGFRGRA